MSTGKPYLRNGKILHYLDWVSRWFIRQKYGFV